MFSADWTEILDKKADILAFKIPVYARIKIMLEPRPPVVEVEAEEPAL